MPKRLFLMALVTALLSFTDIRALQPAAPPARLATPVPTRVSADRHDRSPELRHIAPGRPPIGEEAKEREPRWRRVTRRPDGLQRDSVVQTTPAVPSIPAPSRSVEGIGSVNGVLPPDT